MLRCISKYRSSLGQFEPGQDITDPELEAALLRDSPLSFERLTPASPVPLQPQDKMLRSPTKRRHDNNPKIEPMTPATHAALLRK